MTMPISRRSVLTGAAAAATLSAMPRMSAAADLKFKGELAIAGLLRTPPDQAWAGLIKSFEAAHPGITVKDTQYPSDTFVALFTAQQTAGKPADVLSLNGQDLRRYATNGTLLAIDAAGIDLGRFRPAALTTAQINGKTYGLPTNSISGFPLFFNRKVLEKAGMDAPKSYEDMLALRDKLKPLGIKVFTHPGKVIYLWPVWFFTTFAQTTGNKSAERTIEILTGKGKFTDPDVVQALDLVFKFGKDGLVPREVMSLDGPQALADFAAGHAAFWMQHESLVPQINQDKPAGLDLDVMLMPKLVAADVKSQYPGGPGAIVGVNAKSDPDRQAAALAFIDWATTDAADEAEIKFGNGTVPVNTGVKPIGGGVVKKLVGLSPNLVTYLDWNWPPEITRSVQEGIQGGVAGQVSAAEAAESAQKTLDRLVANGYKFLQ
jgi:raffinose/stachyose/melibiose transport system substrate-binding protein